MITVVKYDHYSSGKTIVTLVINSAMTTPFYFTSDNICTLESLTHIPAVFRPLENSRHC